MRLHIHVFVCMYMCTDMCLSIEHLLERDSILRVTDHQSDRPKDGTRVNSQLDGERERLGSEGRQNAGMSKPLV